MKNQRALLAAAAALTAFVLVMVAFVIPGLSSSSANSTTAVPATSVTVNPTTASQPQAAPTVAQTQGGTSSYAISADQAGTLALNNAPGSSLNGTPGLVTYQGIVAYEVPLSTGMAYIDASSGQVLAAPGSNAGSGGTTTGGEGGEGGEDGEDGEDGDDDD